MKNQKEAKNSMIHIKTQKTKKKEATQNIANQPTLAANKQIKFIEIFNRFYLFNFGLDYQTN